MNELKAIVRQVPATTSKGKLLLYAGFGTDTRSVLDVALAMDNGLGIIDQTDRAAVLLDAAFQAKLGELCGVGGGRASTIANKVLDPSTCRTPDEKAAAMHANRLLFGDSGNAQSLKNSFWGEASHEFVASAKAEISVMLGSVSQRVFWGVELPAILANPSSTVVNGTPATVLAQNPTSAFNNVTPLAQELGTAYRAVATAITKTAVGISALTAHSAGGGGGGSSSGGKPAARIGDMHVCPMVTGVVPHVGGPIALGCPTVLIGGLPAARVGDMVTCVGPPDAIALGSFKVLIGGVPAARMGDLTAHGGSIVIGIPTVLIG
nr:PAAR domain-containing protein [Nevskia sp.]